MFLSPTRCYVHQKNHTNDVRFAFSTFFYTSKFEDGTRKNNGKSLWARVWVHVFDSSHTRLTLTLTGMHAFMYLCTTWFINKKKKKNLNGHTLNVSLACTATRHFFFSLFNARVSSLFFRSIFFFVFTIVNGFSCICEMRQNNTYTKMNAM